MSGIVKGEAVLPTFTWLDADQMIFQRYVPEGYNEGSSDNFLAVYDFRKLEWDFLDFLATSHPCKKWQGDEVWFYKTSRLPNSELGFMIRCVPPFGAGRLSAYYLYNLDKEESLIECVFDFSDGPYIRGTPPTAYALSPDMEEIAYSIGDQFEAFLYRVHADGQIRQLVPHFFRAWLPAWSPDGATIAFMGNETYRGMPLDEVTSYGQMRPILYLPNNLYLLDVSTDIVRKIAEGFTDFYYLQWLPDSNRYLSIVGTYGKTPGIWVIDIETGEIVRIWDSSARYSWTDEGRLFVHIGTIDVATPQEWSLVAVDSPFSSAGDMTNTP